MGATCAKCCLCYCFKLCEFGERFRCCPCCIHNCGPCCQFGDCCDVEGDSLPFVEASENLKEEDAVVYTDRDKNIGEMKNDKSSKGYHVEGQVFGENPKAISSEPGSTVTTTGMPVGKVEETLKSPRQSESAVSFHKPSSFWSTEDTEELLRDT